MQEENERLNDERAKRLRAARRVVVKVGTSTVTGPQGELCSGRIEPIAVSIAQIMKAGRQVVLVSSGAIGLGRSLLQLQDVTDIAVRREQFLLAFDIARLRKGFL